MHKTGLPRCGNVALSGDHTLFLARMSGPPRKILWRATMRVQTSGVILSKVKVLQ